MTVSNAAGEYEQLEKEREAEEQGRGATAASGAMIDGAEALTGEKRPNENGGGEEEGRAGKKSRTDGGQEVEEDEMEIEMEDDEDGQSTTSRLGVFCSLAEQTLTNEPALPAGTTLICTNLPPECNEQIMSALFSQCVLVTSRRSFKRAVLIWPDTRDSKKRPPCPHRLYHLRTQNRTQERRRSAWRLRARIRPARRSSPTRASRCSLGGTCRSVCNRREGYWRKVFVDAHDMH